MPTIQKALAVNNDLYKANYPLAPVGVVLHSVGTPQPSAEVFVKMWQENRSKYFTHYVLDDRDIYQIMPHDRKCYHVGSPGNNKWLGIEMCEPRQLKYTSGAKFTVSDKVAAVAFAEACYHNAVWLIAHLCRTYGWDPQTAVLTHNEISTKKLSNTDHVDPEHLWKGLGLSYSLKTLRNDVAELLGQDNKPAAPSILYRVQVGAFTKKDNAKRKKEAVEAAGFSAFLTSPDGQIWRVQVGAFSVRSNADRMLEQLNAAGFSGYVTQVETAAKEPEQIKPAKSIEEVAKEVIRGEWGAGSARKKALTEAGYDYDAVQLRVNQLMK